MKISFLSSFRNIADLFAGGFPAAPLLWFAPGYGGGCALLYLLSEETRLKLIAGLFGVVLFAFLLRRYGVFFFLSFWLGLGAACGVTTTYLHTVGFQTETLSRPLYNVAVTGEISEIARRSYKTALIIKPETFTPAREVLPRKISVNIRKEAAEGLLPGDVVRLKARLFPLPEPVFRQDYDYAFFAKADGIGATGRVKGDIVKIDEKFHFLREVEKIRAAIKRHFFSALSPEKAGLLIALVTGDRSETPEPIADDWKASGIYHIISISGLHMTIIAGFSFFLFRRLIFLCPPLARRLPIKKTAAAFSVLFALGYTAVAGFSTPACRAFVMIAVVMLGVIIERKSLNAHGLCAAFCVILAVNPSQIFDIGFGLSFAAVTGILLGIRFLKYLLTPSDPALALPPSKFTRKIADFTIINLCAGYAGAPLAAYAFNQGSLYSAFANAVAVPVASLLLMPCLALATITAPFDLSIIFLKIAAQCSDFLNAVAQFFAQAPNAIFDLPSPGPVALVIFYAGLYLAAILRRGAQPLGVFLLSAGLFLCLQADYPERLLSTDKRAVFVRRDENILDVYTTQKYRRPSAYVLERVRKKMHMRQDGPYYLTRITGKNAEERLRSHTAP